MNSDGRLTSVECTNEEVRSGAGSSRRGGQACNLGGSGISSHEGKRGERLRRRQKSGPV